MRQLLHCHAFDGVSDQWDAQPTMKRANESLNARGYATWFDLVNMKGMLLCYGSAVAAPSYPHVRFDFKFTSQAARWTR